jgi:hypothetical protein
MSGLSTVDTSDQEVTGYLRFDTVGFQAKFVVDPNAIKPIVGR